MKINKDLADAVMMVSFICLVLVGTSDFDNETTKTIIMVALGAVTLISAALRFFGPKKDHGELAD